MDNTEATPSVAGESVTTGREEPCRNWDNLKQDYERLGSISAIAREYNSSFYLVRDQLIKQGISLKSKPGPVRGRKTPELPEAELRRMWDEGRTIEEIAQHYGVKYYHARDELHRYGIPVVQGHRGRWKWGEPEHEKRRAAVERGAFKNTKNDLFRKFGKLPKENSPAERVFHQALIRARLSFETSSYELERYWPDVKLHQKPILIEIDGWAHKLNEDKDRKRTQLLEAAGYVVVRFTNEQVSEDADSCVSLVMDDFGLKAELNPVFIIREKRSYEPSAWIYD